MPKILQLEEFWLGSLRIDWRPSDTADLGDGDYPVKVAVVPTLSWNPDDPEQCMLSLQCRFAPKNSKAPGYRIEAEIRGVFRLPPGMSGDELRAMAFVNGGMILYGLLRGQVAMTTGSFPGGKFILPAVHLPDIYDASANKPPKRATRAKTK